MKLSFIDKAILHFDHLLKAPKFSTNYPAKAIDSQPELSKSEKKASIEMMRINHSGEVCAQALYQGQAMMARTKKQYDSLLEAASEENDHLNWCRTRLFELNSRPSLLQPIWYVGSFGLGALAGLAGDKISMGFLAETEHQVTAHIESHLESMSKNDKRSRAVLEQMRLDEMKHATNAINNGAVELPFTIKLLMKATSKVLTYTSAKI